MGKSTHTIWRLSNVNIPVQIVQEWRRNNQIIYKNNRIILRVPLIGGRFSQKHAIIWAKEWITEHLQENPQFRKIFGIKDYITGDQICLPNKTYQLKIELQNRKASTATLEQKDTIYIKLSNTIVDALDKSETIQTLISRIIGQDQLHRVSSRIEHLNMLYFNQEINRVRLKHNKSNWGSCSSKRNINISTRTLLAPLEVQDYVFIHELAHLKEMNHSSRFWDIVRSAMPSYEQHEEWLKLNGHSCNY